MDQIRKRESVKKLLGYGYCRGLILALIAGTAAAWPVVPGPVVPGLSNKHSLTQSQVGEILVAELRCAACHGGIERNSLSEKSAPDLLEVGARISPDYLIQFLTSPSSAQSGTTMPDLLTSRSNIEREQIAEALTHFLVAQSKRSFQPEATEELNLPDGKALYHSIGCIACHGPKEPPSEDQVIKKVESFDDFEDDVEASENTITKEVTRPVAFNLAHVATKYSSTSLSDFLFQPLRVRSSGRMPDMKLTHSESHAIANYLLGSQSEVRPALRPSDSLVALGKKYFQELNCAACHALADIPAAAPLDSLFKADLSRGCLSKTSGNHPRFNLDDTQTQAISAAIKQKQTADSDSALVAKTLTTFNCIACHIRDDFGGVAEDLNPYFLTSEKNLGDDGRIPPPLTLVGAKLRPAWLKKVLFDGESVRPYMATRMPQYGMSNLQHLPEQLDRLDVLKSTDMTIPSPQGDSENDRAREKKLRSAGRELLGNLGLNCIACHNFNGKPSPGNKGIDLMTTYQRLEPGWFNNFVRNPGAYRPRIIMPYSWSNGIAAHQTILDGNTDMQIEAIWYYLSLGTSAADPPGLQPVDAKLSVANEVRTYRGRRGAAGFREIAVGFPEKLSYAFSAETGTLTAIWTGDFIRVDRSGQGSGGFNPASEPIRLAPDVSFANLADENSPWPLRPVMTKEARVNPNPLYPKNLGYQFRGYSLGESSIPTFMYQTGTVEIEDQSVAIKIDERLLLERHLTFSSPLQQSVWFRALAGDITIEADGTFKSGRLRLQIPKAETNLRLVSDDPKSSELLLRLEIPQGKSTLELVYEPLKE